MSSRFIPGLMLAVLTFSGGTIALHSVSAHPAVESFPDPAVDMDRSATKGKRTAVVAVGCFWCTEAVFEQLIGVDKVVSGFSGGDAASARYDIVSQGRTNHAESIEISFDPSRISYGELLRVFFS